MSSPQLPQRASLEFLKKLAKDRLRTLRQTDPEAHLAAALLAVARDYGFPSWRALKAEVERRQHSAAAEFFAACHQGDAGRVGDLLQHDASLARQANPEAPHGGWTGLHTAARGGHVAIADLLLAHGADVNAREAGDHTLPLHWAAAHNQQEMVRRLLDAGSDVHGIGDVHALDAIGWASLYHGPDEAPAPPMSPARRALVDLLVARGARHHIFSAICTGDLAVIRDVVEQNPDVLDRRLSRFERGLTPLQFAIDRQRYDILDLLIELGADVDATDPSGQTALAMAMLRGDREAMQRLRDAGATPPPARPAPALRENMASMAAAVKKSVTMILVPDIAQTLDWYAALGFREVARYGDENGVNFGMVAFGGAEVMLNVGGRVGDHDASLWFYTDRVDEIYERLKARQLDAAQSALDGRAASGPVIEFDQDLEDMFYGARQFCIRDPNGYRLYFIQGR